MFIKNAYSDFAIWYETWLKLSDSLWKSNSYCKVLWRVSNLNVEAISNSDCINDYSINLKQLWKKEFYLIKSLWVQKWDENRNCWPNVWIFNKIEWKYYNPQIWDYILSKINTENNYINTLYKTEWKSINELNSMANSLEIPYCSWSITLPKNKEVYNFTPENNNYIFSWIIAFLIILVLFLSYKLYKSKK